MGREVDARGTEGQRSEGGNGTMREPLAGVPRSRIEWVIRAANHDIVTAAVVLGASVRELRSVLAKLNIPENRSVRSVDASGVQSEG